MEGVLEPFIRNSEIKGISLPELINDFDLRQLDLLHIDTEGYDWKILSQLDLGKIQPTVIMYEYKHLNDSDIANSIDRLSQKYELFRFKNDLFFRLLPFLERAPFDIIHCHFGTMGNIAVNAKNLGIFKGKMILSFYGYDATWYRLDAGYYKNIKPHFDVFITISNYLKEKIIKLGFPKEKISTIPIVVNLEDFVNQKIPQKQQVIKLLTVARLVEKKGVYYSIMAFSKIQAANSGLEYHIIGDGPLFKPLQELIDKLELENKVFLHGALDQEEVKEYYQSAAIFVYLV